MIGDGIIRRLSSGIASPKQWLIDCFGGGKVASGVRVNESTAMNYSAAWAATRIIAESIACMPPIVYERNANGGRSRAEEHELWTVLHDRPNEEMDAYTYHEMQTAFVLNWGNSYALKQRLFNGRITGLMPIHPSRVRPVRTENRDIWYEVTDDNGAIQAYKRDDILHVTGPLSEDGVTGKGVIRQARESIGLGMAEEQFQSNFFGNGAFPAGVLEVPGVLSDEAAKNMREGFRKRYGGTENAGSVVVLREDTKYKQVGWPLEDLQFLGLREFSVTEMARWYRVPPHMLADLTRATYSNIEEQGLEFLTYSLLPWVRRTEYAYKVQLLDVDSQYYVEFLMDALGRARTNERAESNKIQFMHGALTLDEWRAMENRNPLGGEIGGAHFVPVNLTPAEKLFAEPEPAPEPPPQPEPPSDDEPDIEPEAAEPDAGGMEEQRNQAAIDVAYLALMGTIDRMQSRERRRMLELTKHPPDFWRNVNTFYKQFRADLTAEIEPMIELLSLLTSFTVDARAIAEYHVNRAMESLAAINTDCKPTHLSEAVESVTAKWLPDDIDIWSKPDAEHDQAA